jgi:hypothetical protein
MAASVRRQADGVNFLNAVLNLVAIRGKAEGTNGTKGTDGARIVNRKTGHAPFPQMIGLLDFRMMGAGCGQGCVHQGKKGIWLPASE